MSNMLVKTTVWYDSKYAVVMNQSSPLDQIFASMAGQQGRRRGPQVFVLNIPLTDIPGAMPPGTEQPQPQHQNVHGTMPPGLQEALNSFFQQHGGIPHQQQQRRAPQGAAYKGAKVDHVGEGQAQYITDVEANLTEYLKDRACARKMLRELNRLTLDLKREFEAKYKLAFKNVGVAIKVDPTGTCRWHAVRLKEDPNDTVDCDEVVSIVGNNNFLLLPNTDDPQGPMHTYAVVDGEACRLALDQDSEDVEEAPVSITTYTILHGALHSCGGKWLPGLMADLQDAAAQGSR